MDQWTSAIIVAFISGIFSIATLIVQKRQDKVVDKIDKQTSFMSTEKDIRKRLSEKEQDREHLMQEVMILVLDTNMAILKNNPGAETASSIEDTVQKCNSLKQRYLEITKDIRELTHEYNMALEMSTHFQEELDRRLNEK